MKTAIEETSLFNPSRDGFPAKSKAEMRTAFQALSNVHCDTLYINRYGQYPSKLIYEFIDVAKLVRELENAFEGTEVDSINDFTFRPVTLDFERTYMIRFLKEDIMICYQSSHQETSVYYSHNTSRAQLDVVKKILAGSRSCNTYNGKLSLLVRNEDLGGSLELAKFTLENPRTNLQLHYNDDLAPVHDLILKKLHNGKGITLLHGIPGTGKTTYIRHLIHVLNRKVIYIPQDMATVFGRPEFLHFLSKHSGSILIIEDAETLLMERGPQTGGAVANLLNISDGLLSDCLNIRVICTFNVHLSKIDKALLRKGRILARYEFRKLSIEKSNVLLNALGKNICLKEEMTLAEIFNLEVPDFNTTITNTKLGF